jgi:16S rRNA processing protein RimM
VRAFSLAFLGELVGARGLRGALRLRGGVDGPETLAGVTRLYLRREGEAAPGRSFALEAVAAGRAGELVLSLAGVAEREAALALRGCLAFAECAELAPLAAGEWREHELVGCSVEAEDGSPLGRVRGIWRTGGPDVLVVEAEGGREHLVPAAFLRAVDLAARRAVVEVLPGLLDPGEEA